MSYIKIIGFALLFVFLVTVMKLLVFEPLVKRIIPNGYVKPITAIFTFSLQIFLFAYIIRKLNIVSDYSIKWLVYGSLIAIVLMLLVVGALLVSKHITFELKANYKLFSFLSLIVFILVTVTFEEILFRGIIYGTLKDMVPWYFAILISVIIFVLPHLLNSGINLISVVSVLLGGYILTILYELSNSILMPFGFHYFWNFTQGILGLEISGNEVSDSFVKPTLIGGDLITGGTFGIESSIITIVFLGLTASVLTIAKIVT